jgi:formylglycine-generating enzyme required for sulfatase activity
MSYLPPATLNLLDIAAEDPAAWLPRPGASPPPVFELALQAATLGSDDEIDRLLVLPQLADAAWQQAEQDARDAALLQGQAPPPPIAWAEGQSPGILLQGLLPLLLAVRRQHSPHAVPAHPAALQVAWQWRNQWLRQLAEAWQPRGRLLHTLPLRPAGTQLSCPLKVMLWDPHAGVGRVGELHLHRVKAPGAKGALVPLPTSAWLPMTTDACQALDDVQALLRQALGGPGRAEEALRDVALGWDLCLPAGLLWAQQGPSLGGALAFGCLWLLRDLLSVDELTIASLRHHLGRIQASMLADTHITAAIAGPLLTAALGGVGAVADKAAALLADAHARGTAVQVHTAAPDAAALQADPALRKAGITVTGHRTLPELVQHLAERRARFTPAQDALLQALLAHDPNQMQPPEVDDDTLRQVAESDPVHGLPHYALQRWAWWARAAQGALHHRFVPLQLVADGGTADAAPCFGLQQQLLHVNRGRKLPALLLRGAPGAGKSTLLHHHEQHLCHQLLLQWHAGQRITQVPFYLPLSSLRPADDPLKDWLPRQLWRLPAEVLQLLDHRLRSADAPDPVLMLDGLNELDTLPGVTPNQRALDVLQVLRPQVAPAGPLLLCARVHHAFDLDAAVQVSAVDVLPWDEAEVETYLLRRLGTASGHELMAQLREAPLVLDMCRTPFNLSGLGALWSRGVRRLPLHRADLFARLLWSALARELAPPEGTRPRNTRLRDVDLLDDAQCAALCKPRVLERNRLPPWPAGRGQLLAALFRQGRQQWLQLGQRQPPVPARERGAVELPWDDPQDMARPPATRLSVVHWLADDAAQGADATRRQRWREAVAELGLVDDFRRGADQGQPDRGAPDDERAERRFKWRHQSWGEWLASVNLLPDTPEQMPADERDALAAALRQGARFAHATPEAEIEALRARTAALWDSAKWPAPHTDYWQRLLDERSSEVLALACPQDELQRWLRDAHSWTAAQFTERSGASWEQMSLWQKYLEAGVISVRPGPDGRAWCQPHPAAWGRGLNVSGALGLDDRAAWQTRPDGWQHWVTVDLWGPFKERIWQALGEQRRRDLTTQGATLQSPPAGDLDEVLALALLGLADARPWLRWLLLQQLWWSLAPVLADLQRMLEGGAAGAWPSLPGSGAAETGDLGAGVAAQGDAGALVGPCTELQHLRRVLLLLSLDAGAGVQARVEASGMLQGLDAAAGLPADDPLQRQWLALRAEAFQSGVDLRLRLQAGAMLGTLGDSLRFERVPAAGGPGLRLRAGLWAPVPAGRHGIGSSPHDRWAQANEQPAFASAPVPAFQMARLPLTVGEWQHFIDARGYAADAPWWQQAVVGAAGRRWLLERLSPTELAAAATEGTVSAEAAGPTGPDRARHGQPRQAAVRPPHRPRGWGRAQLGNPLQPVVGISLFEALAYAAWAGTMPADAPAPTVPSELLWETGVRGCPPPDDGDFDPLAQPVWPWPVPAEGPGPLDFNHARSGWRWPSPVGVFSLSYTSAGVADAAGNVCEWCSNALPGDAGSGYELDSQQAAAGAAWDPLDETSVRGLRGGACTVAASYCRPAFRNLSSPVEHDGVFGVRLVRVWPPHSGLRTP